MKNKIKLILWSLITVFSFFIILDKKDIIDLTFKDYNYLLSTITFIFFYFYYKKVSTNKINKNIKILSLLFSIFMVVGYSFHQLDSSYFIHGNIIFFIISIIKTIGFYYFFKNTINYLYNKFITFDLKIKLQDNKIMKFYHKKPFLFSFIVLIICFIPYIIAYYPGILNFDCVNQIKEVMGIPNRYMESVVLIDKNVIITNFNPILHTLLLGYSFKLGTIINNVNLGIFIYTLFQLITYISCLSYTIHYMKKRSVKDIYILISLAIYALVPLFPLYGLTLVKDTIYSVLIVVFIIRIYDMIKYNQSKKDYILLALLSIFICLFRVNGLLVVLPSLIIALIMMKKIRIPLIFVTATVGVLFLLFNGVVLPYFKITNTSIREGLSVPFQQTARLAKYHSKDIHDDDKKVIDKILTYDTLKDRYDEELSDNVKNKFNKHATDKDMKNYFNVWLKYFKKYPMLYLDATVNNNYGYFYPNASKWYVYNAYNTKLKEAGFDYHYNKLHITRNALTAVSNAYPKIPLLGLICNVAFLGWIYLFLMVCLIIKKKKNLILILLPGLITWISCFIGPSNTYYRYMLPLTFALPFVFFIIKENVKE